MYCLNISVINGCCYIMNISQYEYHDVATYKKQFHWQDIYVERKK